MTLWGRKVVVVDDDVDALEMASAVLRMAGAEAYLVSAPGQALATVLGVGPDVLLVDIAMPEQDGFALLRKLRTLSPEKGGRVAAATVSGLALEDGWRQAWRDAGFQEHLPKPYEPQALVEVVARLARGPVERRRGQVAPAVWGHGARDRRREVRWHEASVGGP